MGIPLYRERSAVAISPQVKLPLLCPYPAANPQNQRHHHHHHNTGVHSQAAPLVARTLESLPPEGQVPESQLPGQATDAHMGVWRQMPRVHTTRERPSERLTESNERNASSTSRYAQRIVRSQPGTREHDDELRAAELVDLYFQELSRTRAASTGEAAELTGSNDGPRARVASERALDMVARRQRRHEASQTLPVVMDRRTMHETLMRAHQYARRGPRDIIEPGTADAALAMALDQDMMDSEDEAVH